MNRLDRNKADNLWDWLKIATRYLTPAGKQRIAQEIEAHYAEAVETHLKLGEPDLVAKANALAELGDPVVAGKKFRRKHLTEEEAKRLSLAQKRARSFRLLLFNYCIVAFYYWFVVVLTDSFAKGSKLQLFVFILAFFLGGIVSPTIAFLIMKRRWFNQSVSSFSLVKAVGSAALALALFRMRSNPFDILWVIFAVWLLGGFSWLRIWHKVRKPAEGGNGTPRPA